MLAMVSCRSSRAPGTVGISSGVFEKSTFTFGALGKKSSATYCCPVSRLPVRSWARNPRSTNSWARFNRASGVCGIGSAAPASTERIRRRSG